MEQPQRLRLQASAGQGGAFEILAISAGLGNGWEWSARALEDSLALWDGIECYLDHSWTGRSVKDLAGVLHAPEWDAERQGIRARLRAVGPGAGVLSELGRAMLGEGPKPDVGFSADVIFSAEEKLVRKILRVLSVDLVIDPARGGAFLRELNQRRERMETMEQKSEREAGGSIQQAVGAAALPEMEQARALRLQLCEYVLDAALKTARLPQASAEMLRRQFAGRVFDEVELTRAVEEQRNLVSELTGGGLVSGPGRVSGMVTAEERLQAAVDDLLGAPRDEDKKSIQAARLSGIRELYLMLTGDQEMHGGYRREHAQLATTADFTGLVKNALNKMVAQQWATLGRAGYDWWQRIVQVEHFNTLQGITGTLMGTVGELPVVAEGAAYGELAVGDSPETVSFIKYGGYIPLTLELIDRDETHKLRAYPYELASAGMRKISALVAAVFTASSGVGPTLADGGALFNATAVTTAGGHANLLTGALSAAEWETVSAAVYNQPMLVKNAAGYYGTGPRLAVDPKYLLVPRALQLTAMKIIYPTLENAANIYSQNQQRGQPGDVITVPEWTDATNWAAVVDPRIAPAVFVGERFGLMPEIFIAGDELSPAVFMNDEHRLKVRHFLAVWVNDFRPLHKSNVTG